ncbi:MAG: hypothetical protein EA420_01230 [Candidatus Competibacteraceae bacterium]|nr:MAG: hypothetical protein EA420_01230 [Candidatus Competibacteraceae bacterium]
MNGLNCDTKCSFSTVEKLLIQEKLTLSELQSDLLFSLTTHAGQPRQVYLLFERKSSLDSGLLGQLLGDLSRLYGKQPIRTPVC